VIPPPCSAFGVRGTRGGEGKGEPLDSEDMRGEKAEVRSKKRGGEMAEARRGV
jgi:hypothetical protein